MTEPGGTNVPETDAKSRRTVRTPMQHRPKSLIGLSASAIAVLMLSAMTTSPITRASAAAPAGCPVATGMKPLIRGLVDRLSIPPAAGLQASGIYVKWSDLEPSGPGLVPGNPIDVAIAAAGCTTPLRLRVQAGIAAPEWVKQASGGAVSVIDPFDQKAGTVGRFWTGAFRQAYDNLQSELAAAYDSVPNLNEVVASRCSMFYPEPFLRGVGIHSNVTNLLAAGYSVAADQQCQLEEIDSSVSRWTNTRVGVSFNPYQVVNSNGTTGVDESFTEQVMGYCRATAGARCVLENDSIRDPISGLPPEYGQMYAVMSGAQGPVHVTVGGLNVDVRLGAPLAFQTAVALRIGDFWGTLIWARQHHAASVELPNDGTYPTSGGAQAWQTIAEVAQWFQEDPALAATPAALLEGQATTSTGLANLTIDELAAFDTMAGYGDVGSVPFDSVSALVGWPDAFTEAALLTTGLGGAATSVTCPHQRWCVVVINGGGHALPEEAPGAPASVNVSLGLAAVAYVPADGISLVAAPTVSVTDAALSLVTLRLGRRHTRRTASLSVVFSDADPGGLTSDYTVTISWGDGSTTVVPASNVTGGFSARTTYTYSKAGTYSVGVAVSDAGGAALSTQRVITIR